MISLKEFERFPTDGIDVNIMRAWEWGYEKELKEFKKILMEELK